MMFLSPRICLAACLLPLALVSGQSISSRDVDPTGYACTTKWAREGYGYPHHQYPPRTRYGTKYFTGGSSIVTKTGDPTTKTITPYPTTVTYTETGVVTSTSTYTVNYTTTTVTNSTTYVLATATAYYNTTYTTTTTVYSTPSTTIPIRQSYYTPIFSAIASAGGKPGVALMPRAPVPTKAVEPRDSGYECPPGESCYPKSVDCFKHVTYSVTLTTTVDPTTTPYITLPPTTKTTTTKVYKTYVKDTTVTQTYTYTSTYLYTETRTSTTTLTRTVGTVTSTTTSQLPTQTYYDACKPNNIAKEFSKQKYFSTAQAPEYDRRIAASAYDCCNMCAADYPNCFGSVYQASNGTCKLIKGSAGAVCNPQKAMSGTASCAPSTEMSSVFFSNSECAQWKYDYDCTSSG